MATDLRQIIPGTFSAADPLTFVKRVWFKQKQKEKIL